MSLLKIVAQLKFGNPQYLDAKKLNDLDEILFEYQQELADLKDLMDENSKQIVMFRATNGELKTQIMLLASAIDIITKFLVDSRPNKDKS